jgi:FtsP/CotA-like multicopper oxidase with cupredoxin domain
VLDLSGPRDGTPDVRYELNARMSTIVTDTGRAIQALTYNGTAPGPELHARVGELVEIVLNNADVAAGVTIHWHGVDVPNAEDGVAGVTQDAVMPGQRHVYRFRPPQAGTFWYHSHQDSAKSVAAGLYGALIIDPAEPAVPARTDLTMIAHTWTDKNQDEPQQITIGSTALVTEQLVAAGDTVRLRLINTDSLPQNWIVSASSFRVTAIDGTDINEPTDLTGNQLRLAGGGRYDLELTMPEHPVLVRLLDLNQPGVLLIPETAGLPTSNPPDPDMFSAAVSGPQFDPLNYGSPAPTPFAAQGPFDSDQEQILETRHGRRNGLPYVYWTINGRRAPDVPDITVHEGDLVRVRIVNEGTDVHPMHLHGHHALVLSRDGLPSTGSPWWTDTLNVEPGEEFVIAFRADNPGVWMDHCHNLNHAASGMVMHLVYEGVTTPFSMDHGNVPE